MLTTPAFPAPSVVRRISVRALTSGDRTSHPPIELVRSASRLPHPGGGNRVPPHDGQLLVVAQAPASGARDQRVCGRRRRGGGCAELAGLRLAAPRPAADPGRLCRGERGVRLPAQPNRLLRPAELAVQSQCGVRAGGRLSRPCAGPGAGVALAGGRVGRAAVAVARHGGQLRQLRRVLHHRRLVGGARHGRPAWRVRQRDLRAGGWGVRVDPGRELRAQPGLRAAGVRRVASRAHRQHLADGAPRWRRR